MINRVDNKFHPRIDDSSRHGVFVLVGAVCREYYGNRVEARLSFSLTDHVKLCYSHRSSPTISNI